ncbi:DMT family transporter [Mycobacterium hodleri]|uniref:DMT family transporter n=2 Tax=Mycolicibacterium hodleri TaxID=49897 RepID=A0A544VVV4_9MYCO|nr:DMT family transporter [Mycolicibacterium hodleri]
MPIQTTVAVTFFYALGYPIGNMAVNAMSPMAVLAFRFGLAGVILGSWATLAKVRWPKGRLLGHVAVTGLLMQAVQFCALYLAIQHGAPAVLCAVVVAMNPVATAMLAAAFLKDRLTPLRILALVLGVFAVLAACASRLISERGVDPAVLLLLVALVGLAAGGVYQQRFCADVDFRASTAVQNAVALIPAVALTVTTPFAVHDPTKAAFAVAGVVLLNATLGVSLYVRAINLHGAAAVSMLFCVIPAVAGVLSWLMLGQRVDVGVGVGLVLGAVACWLNSRGSRSSKKRQDDPRRDGRRQDRVEPVHQPAVAG